MFSGSSLSHWETHNKSLPRDNSRGDRPVDNSPIWLLHASNYFGQGEMDLGGQQIGLPTLRSPYQKFVDSHDETEYRPTPKPAFNSDIVKSVGWGECHEEFLQLPIL